jgi:hypothetical protein
LLTKIVYASLISCVLHAAPIPPLFSSLKNNRTQKCSNYFCVVTCNDWLRAGRPGDRGSIPGRGKRFFLYPLCPDRLWGPPSLLYNGYRGSFPRG